MKIKVDFTATKDGREDLKVLTEALRPICENYAQRQGKGDAVLAFAEELSKYARECASISDDATHGACAAAVGDGRGAVVIANPTKDFVPFVVECVGMKGMTSRIIDNHRTDVECPLLSTLSPFSVVLIEGETETVAEQPVLFEDGEGGAR